MARLVSLAKATRFLGRCRHSATAPRSLIAWLAILLEQRRTPPPSFLISAGLMLCDATLLVAISATGGGESMFCSELRSLRFDSISKYVRVQARPTIMFPGHLVRV